MIKYNSNNINDWNYGSDNIVKVYRNNVVCYYKITTSGGTPSQTPCYAVVDDISQYSDTEFEDVFNKADEKWYKLNNLNQYEEYGIYGSGRNITYYEGKLTIDDGYEYEWNGSSWVNLGEVSGSSVVEYIETPTSSPYAGIELLTSPSSQSTPMYYEVDCLVKSSQVDNSILGQKSHKETVSYQFGFQAYNTPYYDYGGRRLSTNWSAIGGLNNRIKVGFGVNSGGSKVVIKNLDTSTIVQSTTATPRNVTIPLLCNARYNTNTSGDNYASSGQFRYYGIKIYDNNVLVGNYIPAKNPSTNEFTLYETISQQYCTKIGTGTITGYEEGSVEYPLYYDEMQDPPNNLVFTSMTEAEAYECPWVGMQATIDGTKYVFSGDSQSGYEWVEIISPIPSEYNELEYIEVPRVSRTTTSANLFAVPVDLQAYHKYVLDFTPVNFWDTSYYGVMLGGNDADTNFHDLGIFKLDNGWGNGKMIVSCLNYQLGRTKFNISPYIIQNTRTVISMHMNGYVANNGASISIESNGVEVFTGSSTTKANSSYNPTIGIRNVPLLDMGSSGNNTYTVNLKFHNFAVMTSSDELVYNYLPVERISDGQAGLFETVNQVFYPLLGYTVTKGDPV